MESTAPVSDTWTPEDDLLLKNAIEAGASLEALGKGAVKFSRRFTYKELRDRWHSILYDPVVSSHASTHMFELELSGFSPSTKSIKSENYKGHKDVPEKRKRSIRRHYYAMRKRLRSEFFNPTDFGFLDDNIINDCDAIGSNMREPHDGKFVPGSLRLQKADVDILRNVFPETVREYGSSAVGGLNNARAAEGRNPIGDDYTNRIFRNEFPPDASSLLREDERDPSVPDIKCNDIPRTAKRNASTSGTFRAENKSLVVQGTPGNRLFRSSGKKQLPTCDSGLDSPQGACRFGGSQLLNSPDAETNSPLRVIGCSSPQPLWKTMEDFSVPSIPVCMGNQGTAQDVAIVLRGDVAGKGVRSSVFDIVQSGPFMGLENSSNEFMQASDGDFVDISDSLLNLSNEDELPSTNVDEKESIDKIVNDNMNVGLQNSKGAIQEVDKVKLEPEMLNVEEPCITFRNSPLPVQLEDRVKCEPDLEIDEKPSKRAPTPTDLHPVKMGVILSSPHSSIAPPLVDICVPSTSTISTESRELENGTICCTLNTEDPNIPCNDDIFLLIHPSPVFSSSISPPFSGDALSPTFISKGKIIEQHMNSTNNGKDSSQYLKHYQSVRPSCSLDSHLTNTNLGCVSKPKSLDASRVGVLATNACMPSIDSTTDKKLNLLTVKEIAQAQLKDKDDMSDESQSDDDVPYPSDVEAVVLGMDFDPPEGESHITKQAFRFCLEDAKRIVRLEQCARSSLQRTLTQKGAFAILYGHHLTKYIKKTEVILGRSTDDLEVDIDLRKEGCANKISRRQAIIRMEVDGSFSLKNIGKGAILVNGKSVYTGQSLILSSNCLIEISRMSFAFEINQKYVRHHLDATTRKKTQKNKFDWSSNDIS